VSLALTARVALTPPIVTDNTRLVDVVNVKKTATTLSDVTVPKDTELNVTVVEPVLPVTNPLYDIVGTPVNLGTALRK
jgi:hypothetical protein